MGVGGFVEEMTSLSKGLKKNEDRLEFLWSVIEDKIDSMPDDVLFRLRKKINFVLSTRKRKRESVSKGV